MWAAAKSICSSSISVDLLDVEVIELLLVCQCSFVSLCRISVFVFFFFFSFCFRFGQIWKFLRYSIIILRQK